MSMVDTIADMLARIRNAQKAKLLVVRLPHSKMKSAILNVLQEEGYIKEHRVDNTLKLPSIEIELKYENNGQPVISEIHRVSKSGKRVYVSIDKLKGYYNDMGIYVVSTPRGVMSDRAARSIGVGGELLCKVF